MQMNLQHKKYTSIRSLSSKLVLLLIILPFASFSQEFGSRKGNVKHRLSISLMKSFYENHKEHTIDTKAKLGFAAAYKAELRYGRISTVLIGLEYQSIGLSFKGYYKKPGYTYLFDRSYAYTHELRLQEFQIPLSLKIAFNAEKEHATTPYFVGGIGARYIFSSYSVISNDSTGITVYDAKDNIDFENQLLTKGLNAFFQAGFGLQKNIRTSTRAYFFEVGYRYCLSRIHYDGNDQSNDLNISDAHLLFTIGMRI